MQLLYIALITNQWWIFTNRKKNKIKMDSYDVQVHPIQFQLYVKELFWTFNIIKNIFKYNTILFIVKLTLPHVRNLISRE
jgi:hypothetical protein